MVIYSRFLNSLIPHGQGESPFPVFSFACCLASSFSSFSTLFFKSLSGLKIIYISCRSITARSRITTVGPLWSMDQSDRQSYPLDMCSDGNRACCTPAKSEMIWNVFFSISIFSWRNSFKCKLYSRILIDKGFSFKNGRPGSSPMTHRYRPDGPSWLMDKQSLAFQSLLLYLEFLILVLEILFYIE